MTGRDKDQFDTTGAGANECDQNNNDEAGGRRDFQRRRAGRVSGVINRVTGISVVLMVAGRGIVMMLVIFVSEKGNIRCFQGAMQCRG